jgi:hypothetical protein
MKNLKLKFQPNDEKGIALLFTLGVLSVLLIIALGFATTSITERKAAGNSNDLAVARMLAESAVNRAVGAMRFRAEYGTGTEFDDIKSHDETSTNLRTFDFLWKLNTDVNGTPIYTWPSSTYVNTDSGAVHWQYIDNGLAPPDKKLIGRVAYVVVGAGGKLDPSATVSHNVAAGATSWTNPASKPSTAVDEDAGDIVDRKGTELYEISMKNLSSAMVWFNIAKMNSKAIDVSNLLANDTRWKDWTAINTALGLTDITDPGGTNREQLRKWFIINNPKDPEAFWVDTNGDGKDEPSEMYHRFNLARTDWDTFCTTSPDTTSTAVKKILDNAPTAFLNISTHDGVGIKWLKNYASNLPAATFKDASGTARPDYRANQIAANLIDYCDGPLDGDGTGTNPVKNEVTRDSDTDPTYTGNEITPYINEIAVRVDASATVAASGWSGWGRTFTYIITYYLGAEVVNVYGTSLPLPKATTLTILEGTIFFKYTTPDKNDTIFTNGAISLNNKVITLDNPLSLDYTFKWDTGTANPALSLSHWPATNDNAKITSVNVQIKKAILNYDGIFADFAKPDYEGGTSEPVLSLVSQAGTGGPTAEKCFFSYQVDDPRQNLNDGDWDQAKQQSPPGASYATIGSEGLINSSKVSCTASGDLEPTGSIPTTISTNYIRNAPMQSPWELGFIHRGAKWETINLKTYNYDDNNNGTIDANENGVGNSLGIGAYSKGDANILDQVKMTSATQVYGKVNVQSASVDVLKALLGYVRVGNNLTTDSNPGLRSGAGSGTALDYATDVTNIVGATTASADSILNARNTTPFKTRAQIVCTPKLRNGSEIAQATDATKEEIIGKIVNLTKAGAADTFIIIAMAQSLRDVGAPAGIKISKDLNQSGTIETTSMATDSNAKIALGYRDDTNVDMAATIPAFYETKTDCKLGQYDIGMDEILAEQKIMATVYRDTVTGKWRVLRYEYLDE